MKVSVVLCRRSLLEQLLQQPRYDGTPNTTATRQSMMRVSDLMGVQLIAVFEQKVRNSDHEAKFGCLLSGLFVPEDGFCVVQELFAIEQPADMQKHDHVFVDLLTCCPIDELGHKFATLNPRARLEPSNFNTHANCCLVFSQAGEAHSFL